MLVLARHKNEMIRIGDDILVEVLKVNGDTVRLGIDAPGDIRIFREEVYQRTLTEVQVLSVEEPIV